MNSLINYQKKYFYFFLTFIVILGLLILNLKMVRMGMEFTGYRNMLFFYGHQNFSFITPIIIFVLCFGVVNWLIWNGTFDSVEIIKKNKIFISVLALLALLSQFFFIGIPETNPDFMRYIQYSQILSDKGIFYYFTQWGSGFFTHVDLPAGSLPFGILFALFGQNRFIIQVVSIIISIVTAYFIFLLGERIHSKKCGIIASLLFLSFPFLLTQISLMLVDLMSTFYITTFAFFSYSYQNDQKVRNLVISAIVFFFAVFSKILAPFFVFGILVGLLLITMLKEDTIQPYTRLSVLFAVSTIPCALYLMQLSVLFTGFIHKFTQNIYLFSWDWTIISIGIIIGLGIFVISPLIVYRLKKMYNTSNLKNLSLPTNYILILVVYGGLFLLLIVDLGRSHFYLRSLPAAIGIIPAILTIASFVYIITKRQVTAIPLVLWITIPVLFMPNTMYKYLLPAYPALALVSAMTICWIENPRLQKCITAGAILIGLIIALFVMYPMCMTDSQINVKNAATYLDTVEITNPEIPIIYIPTTNCFQEKGKVAISDFSLPLWFNYYGEQKHEYSVTTVQNHDQYQEIINQSIQKNIRYLIIITDAPSIDKDIILSPILDYYSIVKLYNQGYHDAYWFNTQQVIVLKNVFQTTSKSYQTISKISLEDYGIHIDQVYLEKLEFKDAALSNFTPPFSIDLEFENNSYNTFVIYDWYDESFHRSDTIYQVIPGSNKVTYTIARPIEGFILHLHELKKQQLKIRKISIRNDTGVIVSQTF